MLLRHMTAKDGGNAFYVRNNQRPFVPESKSRSMSGFFNNLFKA